MEEERGPDAVELVWRVPLPEGDQAAHVVHTRHLSNTCFNSHAL